MPTKDNNKKLREARKELKAIMNLVEFIATTLHTTIQSRVKEPLDGDQVEELTTVFRNTLNELNANT